MNGGCGVSCGRQQLLGDLWLVGLNSFLKLFCYNFEFLSSVTLLLHVVEIVRLQGSGRRRSEEEEEEEDAQQQGLPSLSTQPPP